VRGAEQLWLSEVRCVAGHSVGSVQQAGERSIKELNIRFDGKETRSDGLRRLIFRFHKFCQSCIGLLNSRAGPTEMVLGARNFEPGASASNRLARLRQNSTHRLNGRCPLTELTLRMTAPFEGLEMLRCISGACLDYLHRGLKVIQCLTIG
jgi:hypothetical protein